MLYPTTSVTTFKVKRSKVKVTRPLCSLPCWRPRRLQRWAWERIGRGKLLLRCRLLGGGRRFCAQGGRRGAGGGHTVAAARLQLVYLEFVKHSCTRESSYSIDVKKITFFIQGTFFNVFNVLYFANVFFFYF